MITTPRSIGIAMTLIVGLMSPTVCAHEPSGGALQRWFGRLRSSHGAGTSRLTQPASVTYAAAPAPAATGGRDHQAGVDPFGFAAIVNHLRARAGLHPLSYDSDLSSWASQNNAAQCQRGLGHHVNPSCVQNCGWNYSDAPSVAQGWMNSPGHRQNLLSPSISRFGLAFGPGPYWTFNAR